MKVFIVCEGERGQGYKISSVSRSFNYATTYIKALNKENASIEAEFKEEIDDDGYFCSWCYVLPDELEIDKPYFTKSGVDYVIIKEFEI